MENKSRPHRFRKKKLALAFGTFVIVDVFCAQIAKHTLPGFDVLSEHLYRVPSDIYHHDLAKMADAYGTWGSLRYRIVTNSLGFKDESNREVPLDSSRPRVLIIGDSFTEGLGFEYSKTFVGIIARELARDGIDVLNAGVLSYSPTIYYRKIRYLVENVRLKFDRVVVFLDLSDIQDEADFYDLDEQDRVTMDLEKIPNSRWTWIQTPRQPSSLDQVKRFVKSNSVSIRLVSMIKGYIQRPVRKVQTRAPPPVVDHPRSLWTVDEKIFEKYGRRGLQKARQRMDRLAAFLRERRIDLTVVVYPWPGQVSRGDLESKQVTFWREWTAQNRVGFVNLFPPFFKEGKDDVLAKYFIPGDMHFSEEGNRVVAMEFLEIWARR